MSAYVEHVTSYLGHVEEHAIQRLKKKITILITPAWNPCVWSFHAGPSLAGSLPFICVHLWPLFRSRVMGGHV